jgi:type I restriction-modification system DNA methylase subunit
VSEELLARGYLRRGKVHGLQVGHYQGFVLGASTLAQLAEAGIVPRRTYGTLRSRKPDGLVVDLRDAGAPQVKLVIEHKDAGELNSEGRRADALNKVATTYCKALGCRLAALTDGSSTWWAVVDLSEGSWRLIEREDGFLFSADAAMGSGPDCDSLGRSLAQLEEQLDYGSGVLIAAAVVDPTRLAETVWQSIWLASGAAPDQCLATFVEILIFKFLSDLGVLHETDSGVPIDFDTVRAKDEGTALRYFWENVRPTIKKLFPPSAEDDTSVINGTVFDPDNLDHGRLFLLILEDFHRFGSFKHIDPQFKSRVFERFLRNTIPQKNLGQYFTPRNVVKAMVEMSGIEHLTPNSVVADPACGVGGFVLEPLVHNRLGDFRGGSSDLAYRGYDRDPKTIILAKANMLVHLSEVIEADPIGATGFLAKVLNETFHSTGSHLTGSLALAPAEKYDLVMTNPPYVVRGTTEQKRMLGVDPALRDYYETPSTGVEGLFVQLILNGLKPSGRALVIIPDGLLMRHGDAMLRRHILDVCELEAIVSLPKNSFYTTSKKTYILVLRKRAAQSAQHNPVFTYLIGSVGETLDAKRFVIPENDLPEMASQFRLFQGNPSLFEASDPRCKIQPIERFDPQQDWLVDRWWSEPELLDLGQIDDVITATPSVLVGRLEELRQAIEAAQEDLRAVPEVEAGPVAEVSLGDSALFELTIGKRVLKRELHGVAEGPVPLYSANVLVPFGMRESTRLEAESFSVPSVLWGIDGDFTLTFKRAGDQFDITDHCGRCRILHPDLDAEFVAAAITLARARSFDRERRPSLQRMRSEIRFLVPIRSGGHFDLDRQRVLAKRFNAVSDAIRTLLDDTHATLDVIPASTEDDSAGMVRLHSFANTTDDLDIEMALRSAEEGFLDALPADEFVARVRSRAGG